MQYISSIWSSVCVMHNITSSSAAMHLSEATNPRCNFVRIDISHKQLNNLYIMNNKIKNNYLLKLGRDNGIFDS